MDKGIYLSAPQGDIVQGLSLGEANVQAEPSRRSVFRSFRELARQGPSSAFRKAPQVQSLLERSSTIHKYPNWLIERLASRKDKKAFKQRQGLKKTPKVCWTIQNGELKQLRPCNKDCKFHWMRLKAVKSKLRFDTRYQHLKKTVKRTLPKKPAISEVQKLESMLSNSHIDGRKEAGFEELMDKMSAFRMKDSSDDE